MKKLILTMAFAIGSAGSVAAAPVQWTGAGGNDHWYEVIWLNQGITWADANADAATRTHNGQTGYLASITSAAEQAFANTVNNAFALASPNHNGPYVRAWIGGNDIAVEGDWEWTSGEAFGYTNWDGGEPNNLGNEDELVGWWDEDRWNDCAGTCGGIQKYFIEYDNAPALVPVPATLPLLGFAIAGFAGFARKRKT